MAGTEQSAAATKAAPAAADPSQGVLLVMRISLDQGQFDLTIRRNTNPVELAEAFCHENGIPERAAELSQVIDANMKRILAARAQQVKQSSSSSPSSSSPQQQQQQRHQQQDSKRQSESHDDEPDEESAAEGSAAARLASLSAGDALLTSEEEKSDAELAKQRAHIARLEQQYQQMQQRVQQARREGERQVEMSAQSPLFQRSGGGGGAGRFNFSPERSRSRSRSPPRGDEAVVGNENDNGNADNEGSFADEDGGEGPRSPTGRSVFARLHADSQARHSAQRQKRAAEEERLEREMNQQWTPSAGSLKITENMAEEWRRVPVGDRLYANALRQKAEHAQRQEQRAREHQERELAGVTHQPAISEFAKSIQRSGPAWQRVTDSLGREKQERLQRLQQAKKSKEEVFTFRPEVNLKSKAIVQSKAKANKPLHERLYQDSTDREVRHQMRTEQHMSQYPFKPTITPRASSPPPQAASPEPSQQQDNDSPSAAAANSQKQFLERLETYSHMKKQKQQKLHEDSQGFFRFNPVTGKNEFQPFFQPATLGVAPEKRAALYTSGKEKAEREAKAQEEQQRSKAELAQTTHTNAGSDSLIRQAKMEQFQIIFSRLDSNQDGVIERACEAKLPSLPSDEQSILKPIFHRLSFPPSSAKKAKPKSSAASSSTPTLQQLSQVDLPSTGSKHGLSAAHFAPARLFGLGGDHGSDEHEHDEAAEEDEHAMTPQEWTLTFEQFCALFDRELASQGRTGAFLQRAQKRAKHGFHRPATAASSSSSNGDEKSGAAAAADQPARPRTPTGSQMSAGSGRQKVISVEQLKQQTATYKPQIAPKSAALAKQKRERLQQAHSKSLTAGAAGSGSAQDHFHLLHAEARMQAHKREAVNQHRRFAEISQLSFQPSTSAGSKKSQHAPDDTLAEMNVRTRTTSSMMKKQTQKFVKPAEAADPLQIGGKWTH